MATTKKKTTTKTSKKKAVTKKPAASAKKARTAPKKAATKKSAPKSAPASEAPEAGADKQSIIEQFQVKKGDTGSPEVQIALLTSRIDKLVNHLKSNPSDNHSRRGLLGIVSKRRRLLHYLETKEKKRYTAVAKKVGLKK